jgi:hypothetical protein
MSTHDEELVQTRVWSQDVKKPKVVVDYNSMMAGVDMSDVYADPQKLQHELRWMCLTTHVTLVPQLPSRTHVSGVLCATRLVSIVKQGTTVKNAM